MKKLTLTLAVLLAFGGSAGAVELSFEDDFPIVGREETVTVSGLPADGALGLWVVYSPNSETSTEEEIGKVPPDGEVLWTPSRSGIATVSLRDGSGTTVVGENVAILFDRTPSSGVLVMIFAGILLFGGAGFSLRSVLKAGVPEHGSPIDT